jgi:hypothetical protein
MKHKKANTIALPNLKGIDHLGDPSKDRRTVLEWIFKKWGVRFHTRFSRLRTWSNDDLL